MKNKSSVKSNDINVLNIDNLINQIIQQIYDDAHYSKQCLSCNSKSIELIDENSRIYKCLKCKSSFTPKTNSLYQKIKFTNDKWTIFLKCMILDESLEKTTKAISSNSDSVNRKWKLMHDLFDWKQYNLSVRPKPIKNIYADFEIIKG